MWDKLYKISFSGDRRAHNLRVEKSLGRKPGERWKAGEEMNLV